MYGESNIEGFKKQNKQKNKTKQFSSYLHYGRLCVL